MPDFSPRSAAHLAECHEDLRYLFEVVVQVYDCTITDGRRTADEQARNLARGVSRTLDSKHLAQADGLSHAVDAVPHPPPNWRAVEQSLAAIRRIDPTLDVCRCYHFAGFVAGVAHALGIPLRQGVDWDGDRAFGDHAFIDLPHSELK